jgi:alanyl aminopeptidase
VAHFENAQVPADRRRYLDAIGEFRDPELRESALRYTLEGPLRPNEIFTVPRRAVRTNAGRDQVYTWMTRNFEAISNRITPDGVAFLPYLASGCSAERLAAASAFFGEPDHQVGGAERNMAKVADQVADCINLRDREGAVVAAYLSRLARASTE